MTIPSTIPSKNTVTMKSTVTLKSAVVLKSTVNGVEREHRVEARTSLLTYLREQCNLSGVKRGCEEGECGACAVLLDGRLVCSCLIFAPEIAGRDVVTVEGLGAPDMLAPLQQAFAEAGASQCGYCIPGILLAATTLLEADTAPGEDEIRRAISGNLCRCTGYDAIVKAIQLAAARKR